MRALIVGGGIGGLTTALRLHAVGIECVVFEQSDRIRELGVGFNILPHAIKELAGLGVLSQLTSAGIATKELIYTNRFGQEIWREQRGIDAGYDVPQLAFHRGRLQGLLAEVVRERMGDGALRLGNRLVRFDQDADGVVAAFVDRAGDHSDLARGDLMIGADGIHSTVRAQLFPDEGPPLWNGVMTWRGAVDWPRFLTGRSMIIAGGMDAKLVVYPIADGVRSGTRLTNWVVCVKTSGDRSAPPPRQDWSRPAQQSELLGHFILASAAHAIENPDASRVDVNVGGFEGALRAYQHFREHEGRRARDRFMEGIARDYERGTLRQRVETGLASC
jgi:5-methylphenazine-1-carboxylate 1-monooxygenase